MATGYIILYLVTYSYRHIQPPQPGQDHGKRINLIVLRSCRYHVEKPPPEAAAGKEEMKEITDAKDRK